MTDQWPATLPSAGLKALTSLMPPNSATLSRSNSRRRMGESRARVTKGEERKWTYKLTSFAARPKLEEPYDSFGLGQS